MTVAKRRWFTFSLRTLFVVVTVASLLVVWVRAESEISSSRRDTLNRAIALGAFCDHYDERGVPWWRLRRHIRHAMGDKQLASIFLPQALPLGVAKDLRVAFPEAFIVVYPEHAAVPPGLPPGEFVD